MNADRRKRINEIISTLEQAKADVEALQGEEQDAFDNLSEGLQQSERGQATEEAANKLQEAVDGFDTITEALEEARGEV